MGCLLFPAALGGKAAVRQSQDELVRKGLAEMVKAGETEESRKEDVGARRRIF